MTPTELIYISIVAAALLVAMGLTVSTTPRGLSIFELTGVDGEKRKRPVIFRFFSFLLPVNKIVVDRVGREKITNEIIEAGLKLLPEEFILMWELFVVGLFSLACYFSQAFLNRVEPSILFFVACISYVVPRVWMKARASERRKKILRELPDVIDLVALCVNAGLDFSLALKWVIDKSAPSPLIEEFSLLLVETKVGKSRRQALKDMAKRVKLREMSSFTRSLVQAERLGTPIEAALNIIADDVRDMRYRRGERAALLAPLKMLIPLIFFIMPTVGIIVAGPIILKFISSGLPKL